MTISRTLPIGLGLCVLVLLCFVVSSHQVDEKITSKEILLEVDRKLQLLNKPSLKSIKSEDGDIIDCVDIYKQPAFDHPALKNHTIQMKPSSYPKADITTTTDKNASSMPEIFQTWQKSGSCPTGTIPIRRVRKEDLLRADSIERYGMKNPYIVQSSSSLKLNGSENRPKQATTMGNNYLFENRSSAFLLTQGYSYIGARGDLNIWNPGVERDDEYTTCQIWLLNGPPDNFESVEVGWMVNPSFYGDRRTRLFLYWTSTGGKSTGCFDLSCPGFVQISKDVAIGSPLEPVSREWGNQYFLETGIFKDVKTGYWWLRISGKDIGYWPPKLFGVLSVKASIAQWGGEVFSKTSGKVGNNHTTTQMGSGGEARSMYLFAAFIRRIRIVDYSLTERYPEWVHEFMDEPYCYSAYNYVQYIKEPEFYFGGAGRGRFCP